MITDGDFAMGLDPNQDNAPYGPYRAVEGDVAKTKSRNPSTDVASTVSTSSTNNLDQFEIQIKPNKAWGSAYCAVDDGHKIAARYSDALKLDKRAEARVVSLQEHGETYHPLCSEVFVKQDSPKLPLVKHQSARALV